MVSWLGHFSSYTLPRFDSRALHQTTNEREQMEIEIETTEKWWIGDSLDSNGYLRFARLPHDAERVYKEGTFFSELVPSGTRAAVEKQWHKLRPLKENEWRSSNTGNILEFSIRGGVPGYRVLPVDMWCSAYDRFAVGKYSEACLAWFERNRPLADDELRLSSGDVVKMDAGNDNGNPVVCFDYPWMRGGRLYGAYYKPGSVERAQSYWLKNYQWKEDEYLDRESGTVKRMADDEVRDRSGEKRLASGFLDLDPQQTQRYLRIQERNSDPLKINGLDVVASEAYTVDKNTAFAGTRSYRLGDSSGRWHLVTKERFDSYCEALSAKRLNENIVNGYEFRMGEFGVEFNATGLGWVSVEPSYGGPVLDHAREWMKRKGIKL